MLLHKPLGLEHPYEQNPEERFPRQPLADQPFRVGIVTRPSGAVQQLQVRARVDDALPITIDADLQVDWQAKQEEGVGAEFLERLERIDQDVWMADLTAPPLGKTLTYWLEANGERSQDFVLVGEAWQTTGAQLNLISPEAGRWELTVQRGDQTLEMPTGLPALQKTEWLTDGQGARRVRLTFAATPDEAFYGFGERYNALNQRGEVIDVRCYEQYKTQGKRTYFPLPFMLSSDGYGVWVQSNRWLQFDLTQPDTWQVEADLGADETLRLTWFTNDDPFAIVGAFSRLTGPPVLPPAWAFGLWMSSNEWNSQARVMAEVAQTQAHDIPVSVLVIEAWSDEHTFYIWNDAEYNAVSGDQALALDNFQFAGKWHDPKGMVDQLHADGIRVLLWQIPIMKANEHPHPQHDADRAYFEAQGLGVHEPDGSLHKVRPFWFRNGYLLDVTNRNALDWWFKKRAYLLDEIGIDGFKTDGGEHLWGASTRFADGRDGTELWNDYPRLYTEAYYQFATQHKNGDALIFSRAGFVGSQRSPAHWAGDENSTWEAFRSSILAGLSAGISGIPFWGWDIAGFSGSLPDAELYLRSTAMAAFCPIMQYHSEFNQHKEPHVDRTPWNIQERTGDKRVIEVFRRFVHLRQQLMPYIWQEAQFSAETGQPMLRAAQLLDPNASAFQYFFGRDVLVSPVVEPGQAMWNVYLPEGNWRDLWTGKSYSGGKGYVYPTPLDCIPVFLREGASLPPINF